MSVETETSLEVIEALEFHPDVPCSASSCDAAAVWYLVKPCGCPVLGSCDPHRLMVTTWLAIFGRLDCTLCNTIVTDIRWEPIR